MNKSIFNAQISNSRIERRTFIKQSTVLGSAILLYGRCTSGTDYPKVDGKLIGIQGLMGGMKQTKGPNYIPDAIWYEGSEPGDGISFTLSKGSLVGEKFITADMLADGNHMTRFQIKLQEGEDGRAFNFTFGVLNQCSLRVRLPLSLVDQNRWGIEREGAFLKPRCAGDRVDLDKVDRMTFTIIRKSPKASKFCLSPVFSSEKEVPVIAHPILPKGELIDEIGQSNIHIWPGKTKNAADMMTYLKSRYENANHIWTEHMSSWGGWKARKLDDGTGFFRTHHDGMRWWLIDPDGYNFWSTGIDCVRVDTTANCYLLEDALAWMPDKNGEYKEIYSDREGQLHINYLAANYIKSFGADGWREKWAKVALDELKRLRVNTVGNWSEWEFAGKANFPYVRPMSFRPNRVPYIYRDFPDVFHQEFEKDAADYAQVLTDTRDDTALIGYFMMNEPKWAFSSELPAVGMLYNTTECATRVELKQFLKENYSSNDGLSSAWHMPVTITMIEKGKWKLQFTVEALIDLEAFSQIMVDRYFTMLSDACKKVDPNHLNLGIRYAGVPPRWAVEGMKAFDVFSMNCYREKVPIADTDEIHALLNMPIIIGEWHFGALDVGLPSTGIGHVHTQEDRGRAYRVYIEDAAANPNCIGTHWFTLYDQSALGRFDGENYNIGFLDICNRPHQAICNAAIESHEKIYRIASGEIEPFNDAPEYLPKLF